MSKKQDKIMIHVPLNNNKLLEKAIEKINNNDEIYELWKINNVNAIDRLGMTDHGPVHFQIVSNIAIRFARILKKQEIELSVVKHFKLSHEHGELIIFLASVMHDLGMSISREGHEEFSLFLANNLLHEMIDFLPIEEKTIVISETLHAIISHRSGGKPYTLEGAIVRVSDALDLSEGRSRIPYEAGDTSIHSISAAAINNVNISEGTEKPIQIAIEMNNSAGVFQVDELLKSKIKGSGLEKYIEVRAFIKAETEKKLVKEFVISEF